MKFFWKGPGLIPTSFRAKMRTGCQKRGQQLIKFCSKRLSGGEEFFEHGFVGVRADDGDGEA